MPESKKSVPSIITASLTGIAGGVVLGSFLGPIGLVAIGLLGGASTGFAEYNREAKKELNGKTTHNVAPVKELQEELQEH